MRGIVFCTVLVVILMIMCYITLVIYSNLGFTWAVIFSVMEAVKTLVTCIFYIRLISRD